MIEFYLFEYEKVPDTIDKDMCPADETVVKNKAEYWFSIVPDTNEFSFHFSMWTQFTNYVFSQWNIWKEQRSTIVVMETHTEKNG